MADTITPNADTTPEPTSVSKSHFTKAIEEAKAGAQALREEAAGRAGEYKERLNQKKGDWTDQAKTRSGDAMDKAYTYANDGKAKASQAISSLSRLIDDNSATLDEKLGPKYGDYARSAAASIQDAAARLDEKSLEELGEDAKQFVREKPVVAIGIAAAAGYAIARLFSRK
ncbi:MAG TPA: hypothetical protein VJM34_01120 [Novosphingobium sp.]|nr:hypothetical protein [Novosphingobium sp.]